ncbi:hypothetical protein NLJ89_g10228 [Agrocybe chaxingu]|uniref:Uncharacterized protein n=1 Tax=Agrocybe chaxingu TaxID=84603 RepID=A0A9W8JRJ6_9AGAR|nr:hypothetical protein NLJ89_g10228 [Agrocybe chaxingu]
MDDFRAVVKVENNTSVSYNLHRMFSIVGEVPEIYPMDPSAETPAQHSFLKFSSTIFANNALSLKWEIPGLQVLPIHEQPYLIEQYRCANPAIALTGADDPHTNLLGSQQEERRNLHEIPSVTELDRDLPAARSRKTRRSNTISKGSWTSMTGDIEEYCIQEREAHSFNAIPQSFDFSGYAMRNWDVAHRAMFSFSALQDWDMARLAEKPARELAVCDTSDASVTTIAGPLTSLRVAPAESAPAVTTCPVTCETRISMELCGEIILYDLKNLEPDPRVIIELLKATKSERGNYMLVGAFYRRIGNPQAAKAVMNAMIEGYIFRSLVIENLLISIHSEFSMQGVGTSDMKPAYLLLSACEKDLAKIANTEGRDAQLVSSHCQAAKLWLQKVFGIADSSRAEAETKGNLNNSNALKAKELNGLPENSVDNKDIRGLERKIQSLRDRNFNQSRQIAQLQSQKRKLEDDYLQERDLRRKYQRKIDEAERDRDSARKMEKHALDQVKREVAARQQAEEELGAMTNLGPS